jgi:acyl-CoA thioesterase-1
MDSGECQLKKLSKKNLTTMIEMIHKSGAITVLVGVQLPPNYGKFYTNSFETMFIDLANEYNLTLIKGSLSEMVSANLMQSDGIHPNKAGHILIEDEIWQEIKPALMKLTD